MIHLENHLKNAVLSSMCSIIERRREEILQANQKDLLANPDIDQVLTDRLKVDDAKVSGMINSLEIVRAKRDPINVQKYEFTHDNGMKIANRTAPFGTVMIIYESRPDVTIEAAAIAFKSGNKIWLKGGKEAIHSNLILVNCWHQALTENGLDNSWIEYFNLSRTDTQSFFKENKHLIDLVVPRGGEGLISFVKENAECPVLVSGRGNNFLFIDETGNLNKALDIIKNGKLGKISACNALDKVIIHQNVKDKNAFLERVIDDLFPKVEIYSDLKIDDRVKPIESEDTWYEEFLDYKLLISEVTDLSQAIDTINKYSGGHSVSIVSECEESTKKFMMEIDAAAVYHNASTRFTDGGQFGLGAELAISTDKLHHRGPLGLDQLVTNKWFIYGQGQIR